MNGPSTRISTSGTRRWRIAAVAAVAAISTVAALTGCTGSTETTPPAETENADGTPSYYPDTYSDLIEASKAEGGDLVIYSNTDQENWAPILRDFQAKFPWVTNIAANNLDSDEVFQRQLSETATGNAPADMLVSNAVQAWATYIEEGAVMPYESPELEKLPDFAQLMPGVYAMSLDPVGLAYNTSVITEPIASIADLAKVIEADPASFQDKITTRDVNGAFGFTVSHAWAEGNPKAWDTLEAILPSARPESSSGTQREKILSGEYAAGFLISSAVAYPAEADSAGLLKFVLPTDGTVVLGRGIGITPEAPHPATAKLFLDFVLSAAGQSAVAEGGLTSYREGVELREGIHTYQEIEKVAGKDGIIRVPYEIVSDADVNAFVAKWDGLLAK